mmetsp:Transcript_16673/g.20578  ORF Transcript_16673/g.20578 Transcript_16673/m.20578 type:complete len:115 (-) Transcript_16673:278-622(-)
MNAENDESLRVRERQWLYLGPVLASPFAHIAVTLYRDAKTTRQKHLIVGVGVIGATVTTVSMRLYLMYHAGLTDQATTAKSINDRTLTVTPDEKDRIETPSFSTILREVFRGFG